MTASLLDYKVPDESGLVCSRFSRGGGCMMVSLLPFLDGPDDNFLFLVLALERWKQRSSVISSIIVVIQDGWML
jgi:hypothetical protein